MEKKLPKNTQVFFEEIKRLRKKGMTYEEVTNNLNDNGWTTIGGKKFYGTYVHNMEKRFDSTPHFLNHLLLLTRYLPHHSHWTCISSDDISTIGSLFNRTTPIISTSSKKIGVHSKGFFIILRFFTTPENQK